MNETFEIEITGLVYGGYGIGRLNNFVYFLPGALPGEKVLAEKISEKKNYGFARPLDIQRTSQKRILPACPLFFHSGMELHCPGCAYQHLDYEEEIIQKNLQFLDFLKKAGFKAEEIDIFTPSPSGCFYNYRNKIVLHPASDDKSGEYLGYFSNDNRTILKVENCPIARQELNDCLSCIYKSNKLKDLKADCRKATIRYTKNDGAFFWFGEGSPDKEWIKEETVIGTLSVPKGSFFQVNMPACDILVQKIMEILKSTGAVYMLDLYCGSGLFSIAAGKAGFTEVTGIDSDAGAVRAAKFNASSFGFSRFNFITAPVEKAMPDIIGKIKTSKTVLLIDPPRSGLTKNLAELICRSKIKTVIYVSCAPDTLSRDLKIFRMSDYRIKTAGIIDMFPRTAHFESVVVLER